MDPGRHTQYKITLYMAASLIFFRVGWLAQGKVVDHLMTLVPGLERLRHFRHSLDSLGKNMLEAERLTRGKNPILTFYRISILKLGVRLMRGWESFINIAQLLLDRLLCILTAVLHEQLSIDNC
jgi:hypothetical protein